MREAPGSLTPSAKLINCSIPRKRPEGLPSGFRVLWKEFIAKKSVL